VEATTHYNDPDILAKISRGLGSPMKGISVSTLSDSEVISNRGW
ncbi:MAG: pyridoxal 5'-phosphate synthase lyase subunit PdxS, partial [Actinomycetota bacterium]|nr:pyridoxal 5'-phosphate synthase lyase subunit PdxS [Actinomycetota bacterium]